MDFELLQKLMPFEINRHVIEQLDVRLVENQMTKLTEHRSIQIHRDVFQSPPSDAAQPGIILSSLCRMGAYTQVVGQLSLKQSMKTVVKGDLELTLNMKLPRDTQGMVRRDTMEDKEKQVQGNLVNKVR